jgi:hypothetical protein
VLSLIRRSGTLKNPIFCAIESDEACRAEESVAIWSSLAFLALQFLGVNNLVTWHYLFLTLYNNLTKSDSYHYQFQPQQFYRSTISFRTHGRKIRIR